MARLLALEWDDTEARAVIAGSRGGRVVAEQAFSIALDASQNTPAAVGRAIAAALADHKLGRVECLVAVGRSSIELKHLQLPPAPEEELPDLVRFQAMRDFNTLGENWPLDYIPLSVGPEQPGEVLAAAISPELIAEVQATLQAATLEPKHLVLRPCAAASLLRRSDKAPSKVRLLVDMLEDEVDLTVLSGDRVVYLRTARLAHATDASQPWRPLLMEIRRTLAAASNRLGAERVTAIHVGGDAVTYSSLLDELRRELGLEVAVFDPFAAVDVANSLKKSPPHNPGSYTPLLGMLADEAAGSAHDIDFLHPRRRPEVRSKRGRGLAAAAVATVAVAVGYYWYSSELGALDSEISRLTAESKGMVAPLKAGDAVIKRVSQIEQWLASDITWIDEIYELSQDMPPAKQVVLSQVVAVGQGAGGELQLEGNADSVATIAAMDSKLRDDRHRVEGKGSSEASDRKGYPWRFKSVIDVVAQPATDYLGRWKTGVTPAPPKPAASSAATPTAPGAAARSAAKPGEGS